MRFMKMLLVLAVVAAVTAAATIQAQSITQYGKAAWAAGTYPGGPNVARVYGRSYMPRAVYSAPVVATTPATGEQRRFSAEPGTPGTVQPVASAAPAAPATAPCPGK
jgi:hypothetical protein